MTLNNCTVTIGQYVESQTVETQYVGEQVVGEEAKWLNGREGEEAKGRNGREGEEAKWLNGREGEEAKFKYVSPFVTDEVEREKIHKTVVNLVTSGFRLSAICEQLNELIKEKKIAMYVSTADQYAELVRLGLPEDKEGYSQKNYENYMSKQKR